jgi:hypothetical protein
LVENIPETKTDINNQKKKVDVRAMVFFSQLRVVVIASDEVTRKYIGRI